MADDGMLLNFSIDESLVAPNPTAFKGGRWKDRLTAKKAAQYKQAKLSGNPLPPKASRTRVIPDYRADEEYIGGGGRDAKRQRTTGDFRPAGNSGNAGTRNTNPDAPPRPSGQPKQIISSLFSYNPKPKLEVQTEPAAQEDGEVQPSNAPLDPALETFTSLGVSPTLASHLLNKMDIKAPTSIQKAALNQLIKEDTDAFIQAQTGSGKTLAYLLPIVQRIMSLKQQGPHAEVHRDSGLFAIILAPTRELSKQIAVVLENLLRCAHWIVAGTVIGGEKKKSEKARLRKGLNILVATPGRLADHLDHTEALDVSNVRWLVLDEGDRLMELGFEDEIQKIVSKLNLRMKASRNNIPGLPTKRTTILCSATMKMNVQRLGEISLKEAVHISADPSEKPAEDAEGEQTEGTFTAPAQLKQSYAIVPAKLRLVSLIAFLKKAFARRGTVMKAIVFISCADSVDFHYDVLTNDMEAKPEQEEGKDDSKGSEKEGKPELRKEKEKSDSDSSSGSDEESADEDETAAAKPPVKKNPPKDSQAVHALSPLLSSANNKVTTYKLHGSLAQAVRTSTLNHFARNPEPSVLIATDVASRGLDLPNVDLVLEYDPAFARDDHIHRIGRTARAGKPGRACIFLMPGCEESYIEILAKDRKEGVKGLTRHTAEELLQKGFTTEGVVGGKRSRSAPAAWEEKATDLQLNLERWALAHADRLDRARKAYISHVRAYATHVAPERPCFDIKALHLGHLAKAFALRDRPGQMRVPGLNAGQLKQARAQAKKMRRKGIDGASRGADKDAATKREGEAPRDEVEAAAQKMKQAIRTKRSMMMGTGADEFNLG